MAIQAPVAVELGWFLVSNSGSLTEPPLSVLERYRRAVASPARPEDFSDASDRFLGDWQAQVDLSMIIGLLLRGFRKGLDAEAGVTLASGVSARDDLAWWCERAVTASARLR
jgi:hypothetical protein